MSRRSKILIAVSLLTLVGVSTLSLFRPSTQQPEPVAAPASERRGGEPATRGLEDRSVGAPDASEGLLAADRASRWAGLPGGVSPLAYAQAWNEAFPPAMAAFRDWTMAYVDASTPFDQALLELEGIALARKRRLEMLSLIESDPELALAMTVPAALRALLPPAVEEQLETRVSGRGDYEILMAVQPIGARRPEEQIHRVTLGRASYEAHVYGRRVRQTSQEGASLHGIALDGHMAVHESPLRVLEPGEIVPAGIAAGRCPVSGAPVAAVAPESEVNLDAATVVEVDGRLWQLASAAMIDALESDLVAAEDQAGPAVPAVMAGESVLPLPPTSWTTGNKTLLIIRVDFSDKPGDPVAYQTALDLINNSVSPYYDTASYGTTSITPTVTATTYRMPQTGEAYATGDLSSQLYTDATTAAGADYTIANYQHVMILFTRLNSISGSKFTWAGLGSVGGGRTWINGYYDFRVTAHELGHNYGLYHANLWQVADGNPASASGSSTEYADPFDVMGGGSTDSRHHFNPWFKNRMGWLPDASVLPVTASGTYRIARFDAKATTLSQNLALNVFCDGRRTTWVGFRQNFTSNSSLFNGAYVVWGFANNTQSQLLDMTTPGSSANDAGLAMGVTFTDTARGIAIRPVAKGGTAPNEYLDVEVTLGQPASPFVVGWGGTQAVSGLPAGTAGVRAVAAGSQHALALKTDGTVIAWGSNTLGQSSVPSGLAGIVSVAARGSVSGAVASDGSVALWGDNTYGQTSIPSGLAGVRGLAVGGDHVLAVRTDGTVVAWGNNSHGETTVPSGLAGVTAVAAGTNSSYALRSNGTVTQWGGASGSVPAGLSGVIALAAGSQHVLALKGDGTVVAWGSNNYGQSTVPAGLADVTAVAASAYHSVALKGDGTVVQWGYTSSTGQPPVALSRVSALAANDSCNLVVIGSTLLASPSFTAHPQDRAVAAGQSAQFSVTASGSGTLAYQWQRSPAGSSTWTDITNNATYSGATTAALTVAGTTAGMSGDRFRCVASYAGTSPVESNVATLTVNSAPVIGTQPVATAGTAGGSLTLSVAASGSGTLTYQWYRDGVAIAGATGSTYTIPSVQAFHAGTYTVVVSSGGASATSSGATVTVNAAPSSNARPLNLSTRALARTGDSLIPGFVIEGSGTKRLLIRAVGPTLGRLGVPNPLADPRLVLKRFDAGTNAYVDVLTNDDWGTASNAAEIMSTASSLNAFSLNAGSTDAAALVDLAPGRYTVVADGKGGADGLSIVELYDADAGTPTARMVNISNRGYVGVGGEIMIPGFVVSSEGSRTFLIRAVGPSLARFGVTGVLANPQLTVFRGADPILTNDDWDGIAGSATTASVAAQVSAFSLSAGSADAAFVVTLPPGAYTVQASGVGGTTGVALVEVYLVP
ncbi:MAG: immunoglobulin domain-containing protein [Opitutaceae bacterium]|nr:immunoglobulin domain-containing protein [Opitutaceae bacterium]